MTEMIPVETNPDLLCIDNEFSSGPVPVTVGGWKFRLRPLGNGHREWLVFANGLRAEANEGDEEFGALLMERIGEFLVEHCVMGWEGAKDNAGETIAYSPETAREVFNIHIGLAMAVFDAATNLGTTDDERAEAEGEAAGKSHSGEPSGAGSSQTLNGSGVPASGSGR